MERDGPNSEELISNRTDMTHKKLQDYRAGTVRGRL